MMDMEWHGEATAVFVVLSVILAFIAIQQLYSNKRVRDRQRVMGKLARRRGERLTETLRLFQMAEQISDLGIWQYYPEEDCQIWSDGLKKLFGIEPDEELVAGDAETLLVANDVDLVGTLSEKEGGRQQIDFEFSIRRLDGERRELSLRACQLRDRSGIVSRVVAIVLDVTAQRRREQRLKKSREIALREVRRARELSETDALTGLANRRKVMAELDRLAMKARKDAKPLSLIVFDIDHFKKVNDTYGHQAGDDVLRKVARIIKGQARKGDVVGRIGGEEFVWILQGAQLEAARLVADRLRLAIAMESGTHTVPPVTVSLGLANVVKDDTSLSLFARADSALYDAKNAGRNLVKLAA